MSEVYDSKDIALQRACELILLSAERSVLKKAVLSKPQDKSVIKTTVSPKLIKDEVNLQAESFMKDGKALHKNIPVKDNALSLLKEMSEGFSQINIITSEGECEYKCSSSGKTVLLGADKLLRKLRGAAIVKEISIEKNNREKRRILNGSEQFLIHLGVSDENGRIFDKKMSKFKQINRFLEHIRDIEDKLPQENIRICDLCCGKSYLSFAVYHYFANIKKYNVSMTAIDLKSDVIEYCSNVAKKLDFHGLEFICGDINEYETENPPELVISLHACDIATDIVLNKAAKWNTDVILSTPCCHHEMNKNISCPALSFITDYSMLRQKLSDAATDALRLLRLEAYGYETAALELIDPDETPKNILLRAIRRKNFSPDSQKALEARERYLKAKLFLCGEDLEKFHF
ncbi:MAG: SAM-dependent methyltransferase [Clostridia bacterium]|jgi:hypothetical protein|nr:SAM-dependent methyltransferase [Clostridia bacterium]